MIISINQVSKCSGPQPSSSWPLIISNLQTSFSTTSLLILMRHQLKWSRNELKATRQLGDLRNWKIWHEVVEGRLWFWPYHNQNIISLHTEGANTSFCGPTWKISQVYKDWQDCPACHHPHWSALARTQRIYCWVQWGHPLSSYGSDPNQSLALELGKLQSY